MKMPVNKVPTHAKWKTLRDKSGGKKGLAKVNIGKSLDNFHAAAEKTEKSGDVAIVSKAMSTLKKNLKLYDSTISKKKEYKDLANMLKRDMLSPLDAFGKGFAQMAAAQGKEINKVENNIRNVTAMVIKESGKLTTQFKAMNKEMSGIAKKYADGVPDNDKKNLVRFMKDVGVKVKQAPGGIKMLDGELNDLVSEYARDHRPLINKYNSTLGKAKKGVKESSQEVKRAKGYLTALAGVLKKA
jgi:hypothetical protein